MINIYKIERDVFLKFREVNHYSDVGEDSTAGTIDRGMHSESRELHLSCHLLRPQSTDWVR